MKNKHLTKRNAQTRGVLYFALLGCILGGSGCEYQSTALNDRMADFQYSVDSLSQEMITRLKSAHIGPARKKSSANSRASQVSQMEADRGGDGDRPDPNSVTAIAVDCAAKIKHMQSLKEDDGAVDAVLKQVNAATDIKEDVRKAFAESLQEELNENPS
ncbi:hypothetical protein DTL42_18710 [Bremerella cremea]|uniref:Lipoprotein n=1 Tax=Bremerella cremea TaxID=1031537 RepID=A0A368KMF8_9BACT|nr:hypothetical protein [Bremerella cremea]RCS43529.1 hypothetical protein DTL42_18710 [Bremerella cremea]